MLSSDQLHHTTIGKIYLEPLQVRENGTVPEQLEQILQPVEDFELESLTDSSSDISNPLAEFVKDSIYSKKDEIKHLSKAQIHQKLMDGFTEDFKRVTTELHKETVDEDNLFYESKEEIEAILKAPRTLKPISEKTKQKREKAMSWKGILVKEALTPTPESEDDKLSYDYMSGIWRMLNEKYKDKSLKVTQKGYNAYRDEEPYWLQYPEVSRENITQATTKCTTWLNEYCEK